MSLRDTVTEWWLRRARWQQITLAVIGVAVVAQIASPGSGGPQVPVAEGEPSLTTETTILPATPTTQDPTTTESSTGSNISSSTTTAAAVPAASTGVDSTTTTSLDPQVITVIEVVDGDTLTVAMGGINESLRLIGINSPEGGECFAADATARLTELVAGRTVTLISDVSDRDQYGRLLRYVYLDDVFVNEVLVREGYAIARRYEPDTAMATVLEAAQAEAKAGAAGLWATTACGTRASATLTIGPIHFDAGGNDNNNLNDEWVDFANTGTAVVDLSGWTVKDESASHRYHFPPGFTLAMGATVRLHTGCGTDNAGGLYWCNQGSAVWNNDGDTVFLLDPSGNVFSSERYRP